MKRQNGSQQRGPQELIAKIRELWLGGEGIRKTSERNGFIKKKNDRIS